MTKIKVLHLTSTRYGIGGVEKLLLDMADKYDFSKFDISYCNLFCDTGGQGAYPTAIRQRNLNYYEIPGNRLSDLPKIAFRLASLLRREKIDILHLHMRQATIAGGFAGSWVKSVKILVTRHNTLDSSSRSRVIESLDRFYTRKADHIVAVSRRVKDDLIKIGVAEEKLSLIYNGTDIALFDRKAAEISPKLGREKGEILIGTVGSLFANKGQSFLLRALPAVLARHPNARLVLVGDGPERENLENLSRDLKINDKITFLGFQSNVCPILKKIDLYVQPSLHESFGIAILEAMTAGKGVVATRAGGIPEIVVEGETGFLVEPGKPEDLARVVSSALEDREQIERMGQAGRRRVESEFNIEKTVESYQRLYLRQMNG